MCQKSGESGGVKVRGGVYGVSGVTRVVEYMGEVEKVKL